MFGSDSNEIEWRERLEKHMGVWMFDCGERICFLLLNRLKKTIIPFAAPILNAVNSI